MADKLTYEQVTDMRKAYMEGATQGSLARRYRMSVTQIARIVRGESWAKIPQPRKDPTEEELLETQKRLWKVQEEVNKRNEMENTEEKKTPSFDPLKVWLEEGREALVEKIQNDPLRAYATEPPPDDMPINPLEEE